MSSRLMPAAWFAFGGVVFLLLAKDVWGLRSRMPPWLYLDNLLTRRKVNSPMQERVNAVLYAVGAIAAFLVALAVLFGLLR